MFRAKIAAAVLIFSFCSPFPLHAANRDSPPQGSVLEPAYPSMPAPGKKVWINSEYYIVYGFDKKPKLGTIILKLEMFAKDGKKDTSFEVLADSGMPSMKGAHETGEQSFKLSKKGDYLLPVNIVMPGDWEVRLTILKAGKVIFRGSHQFDV